LVTGTFCGATLIIIGEDRTHQSPEPIPENDSDTTKIAHGLFQISVLGGGITG